MTFPCQKCRRISSDNLRCKKCQGVYYCGRSCQVDDWKRHHKLFCAKVTQNDYRVPDDYSREGINWNILTKEDKEIMKNHYQLARDQELKGEKYEWDPNAIENDIGSDHALFVRWGGLQTLEGEEVTDFMKEVRMGAFNPGMIHKKKKIHYVRKQKNVRDRLPMRLNFHFGHNYVSIGYTDLTQLLVSEYDKEGLLLDDPVTFLGIDQSPAVVAKSWVLHQMMIDELTTPSQILQVWYSTCLTPKAKQAMMRAKDLVLQQEGIEDLVKNHLQNICFDISLDTAMKNWRCAFPPHEYFPLNVLVNATDRMDYACYLSNGLIFSCGEESFLHGNPFVLSALEGQRRQNFFYLVKHFMWKWYNNSFRYTIESYFAKRCYLVKALLTRGKLKCNFKMQLVVPNLKDPLVSEIRALNPAVIDWNTFPDRQANETFHTLANACASEHTLHCVMSVNWRNYVYGSALSEYAFLKDYQVEEMVKAARNFARMERRKEFKNHPHLHALVHMANSRGDPKAAANLVLGYTFKKFYLDMFYGKKDTKLKLVFEKEEVLFCDLVRRSSSDVYLKFVVASRKTPDDVIQGLVDKFIIKEDYN